MIVIAHVPPGSRVLEANMGNELVSRFDSPTAQGIPASTQALIRRAVAVLVQIVNEFDHLMVGLRRACSHALETADDLSYLPMIKPCESGFSPFLGLLTFSIDGDGDSMSTFRARVIAL